ncbi:MAG: serine hydrolase [Proteobacteria bacterium]|nr:serine hydrolase [Pseudomonadota bacterium]
MKIHTPRRIQILLLMVSLCSASPSAHALDGLRMDEVISSLSPHAYMGSLLVAEGDDIVLHRGYGYANLEWGAPNDRTTKFLIGPLTKQFTAAAILLLSEQGKLSVQDPISKHLSDAPAAWSGITIYHLLTHTSGITNLQALPDFIWSEPFPTSPARTIARVVELPLEFEPGTAYDYSNTGYVILGAIIEAVSGVDYAVFLKQAIFAPLGMQNTGYASNSTITSQRASGYSHASEGLSNARYIHMSLPFAAGGLYSTSGDLHLWMRGLFGGKVLSEVSLAAMLTPNIDDYGFGLAISEHDGLKKIWHVGGINGFGATMAYFPERDLSIVVLSNMETRPATMVEKYLQVLALGGKVTLVSERQEIDLPERALRRFEGVYRTTPEFAITITLNAGVLTAQGTGDQVGLEIYPESKTRFFSRRADVQYEFVSTGDDEVSHLVFTGIGGTFIATREQ